MFENAFGVARVVGIELQILPVLLDHRRKPADRKQAPALDHQRMIQPQLLAQQFFGSGIEVFLQVQQDHLAAPPPLDRSTEVADEVLGVFLHFDVTVAQHAERAVAQDLEAGKQQRRMAPHQFLDPHPRSTATRQTDEAGQGRRDQDHLRHRRTVRGALQLEQDSGALVGDEGEGVRRIDRLWRQHRDNVFLEIVAQPLGLTLVQGIVVNDANAGIGQFVLEIGQHVLLRVNQVLHRIEQRAQLLLRGLPVDRKLVDLATHLRGNPCHADHHELVKVAAADRKKPQPLQQRVIRVDRLGQHAAVEGQPAQLAIEEPLLHGRQAFDLRWNFPCRHYQSHCASRVTVP